MCMNCKTVNESCNNFHVDHDNPSFKNLRDNFLEVNFKEIPKTFIDCDLYKSKIFKKEDEDFKNKWINYHNNNCNLQILCKKCNLSKKRS